MHGFAARIHQGAELIETIGGCQAGGGKLPEPRGDPLFGQAAGALQIGGEGRARGAQQGPQALGLRRQGAEQYILVYTFGFERCG